MQTEKAHSILTSKGQTTVPSRIREALQLKAGDRILYEIKGDTVVIRPHPGAMAVFGSLKPAGDKAGVPFAEARQKARENRLKDGARKVSR
jgi:AbrB family looped-hinge helix DNA binding protein